MLFDNPNLLSNEEIRERLTSLGYPTELIDSIIQQFWFHDAYDSFIAITEHFEVLKKFLADNHPTSFSRFDFYECFFEAIPHYKELRKSLHQLGLIFEQMQTAQMELDEFKDILQRIDPAGSLSVDLLKDQKIVSISEKDGVTTVSLTHHTMSEFLASDYIISQKEPIDELKKLLIDSSTGKELLKPSWAGTFRFLLEQDSNYFIEWSLKFFSSNTDALVDHISEVIIFATSQSIRSTLKKPLFDLVFGHYQNKKFWIPVWAYHSLYKFIDEDIYNNLKEQAGDKNYVHKGNIAATIDGMLQNNHPLITLEEKKFWKKVLISYANEKNENKVINRHALAALENFKDETDIIKSVEDNFSSPDSLVRDAFISLCRAIDPNSPDSINFFIKAISDDLSQIYARNALYSINTDHGILIFLQKIVDNPKFIHEFLDNESIFNNKDKKADTPLIENIRKNKNGVIINLLKKLIVSAYTGERNYDAGKSHFLQQITLTIQSSEPHYLNELIKVITALPLDQKRILFINDIECILSVLLKPDKLEPLRKVFTNILDHHAGYAFAQAVRLAPYSGNPEGAAVLAEGIKLGITVDPKKLPKEKDYKKQQENKIYKEFQHYLNPPKKGTYFPQVFRHFIEHRTIIETRWGKEDKDRLLSLALESSLEKIDPLKFNVQYHDQKTKTGEYTISSLTSYFTAVLNVIQILNPASLQKSDNRRKVINYIPFSYSSDYTVIKEILGTIKDEELTEVNALMLNKNNDARYLIPQTYIYFARTNPQLSSPKEVLLSLIADPLISESDHEYALENLANFISPTDVEVEKLLKKLWQPKIRSRASDIANALLISVFQDEGAISWRFESLKSSATPFRRQEGFHSVGNLEMELDSKYFAKPLINLNNEKYLEKFIELLEFSLTIVDKPDHREYVNYLWNIVISFIARENFLLSIEAMTALKSWAEAHEDYAEINWLVKRISELSAQNNVVIKIVEKEEAIRTAEGKTTKWTYPTLSAALSDHGSKQNIAFFISHASTGSDADISVGENDFVKKLNEALKGLGYITFFDEDYKNPMIKAKMDIYLPKSKFMIPICSKRYRRRACEENSNEIKTELYHFKEREDGTNLICIYPVLYKLTRSDWKVLGIPTLQGNRIMETAAHNSTSEVNRVIKSILSWIEMNDPDTIAKQP